VSFQRNRASPYRSPQGVGSRKAYDGDAGIRGEKKRMPFCNGADTGCIRNLDNITGRESGLTSLWSFTRESLINRLMRQSR
jgi:hypothetical protein